MFKKKSSRFLSLVSLVLTLLMGSIVPSFADTGTSTITLADNSKIEIQLINDTSYIATENDERLLVSVKENKNETITTLKNLETGKEGYLLRDEVKGTIYSSITGKTINLDNEIYEKEGYSSRDGDIFIGTRYMSYDTISTLAGINGGITLMASVTLAYYNVPYSSVVILITGVLAGLGIVTAGAFKLAFPNGGLKFDLYDIERSSVRGGVTHYYYVRSIKNVKHLSVI